MHKPGIMCYHQFCFSYQVGTFVEFKFATGVINFYIICRGYFITCNFIFRPSQQNQWMFHLHTKFFPFMYWPFLGAMCSSDNAGYITGMMSRRYIFPTGFFFFCNKIIKPLSIILYAKTFNRF